ncbi:MAG: type II toxin-antitoxin system VapC family toxin [bacterium]
MAENYKNHLYKKKTGQISMTSLKGIHSIYADAGFFIALFSKKDSKHERALELFDEIRNAKITIYTSWFVVSEALTILLYHYGYSEARIFSESLDLYRIIYPDNANYYEALSVFNRHSIKKKISLVDALSQVIICQRLNQIPAISFDKDFRASGLTTIS